MDLQQGFMYIIALLKIYIARRQALDHTCHTMNVEVVDDMCIEACTNIKCFGDVHIIVIEAKIGIMSNQ